MIVLLRALTTLSHDCAALYGKALHDLLVRLAFFLFLLHDCASSCLCHSFARLCCFVWKSFTSSVGETCFFSFSFYTIVLLGTLVILSHDCAALYGKALHALLMRFASFRFPFARLCVTLCDVNTHDSHLVLFCSNEIIST